MRGMYACQPYMAAGSMPGKPSGPATMRLNKLLVDCSAHGRGNSTIHAAPWLLRIGFCRWQQGQLQGHLSFLVTVRY